MNRARERKREIGKERYEEKMNVTVYGTECFERM